MSMFLGKSLQEVVLFSALEGRLLYEGEPLPNAKVRRLVKWKNDTWEEDSFHTDDNGYFSIPTLKVEAEFSPVSQFVVAQELRVHAGGEDIVFWTTAKMGKAENDELNGRPVGMVCEVSNELEVIRNDSAAVLTSCTWKNLEEE